MQNTVILPAKAITAHYALSDYRRKVYKC